MQGKNTIEKEIQLDEINCDIPRQKKLKIIDVKSVYLKTEITKSDIILCICNIGSNNWFYNYDCSNKTTDFWNSILGCGCPDRIFEGFSAETLNKYWMAISKYNLDDFSEVIKNNADAINESQFKLKTIINSVSFFLETNKIIPFLDCLYIIWPENVIITCEKDINNNLQLLGNKRNNVREKKMEEIPGNNKKNNSPESI